MYCKLDVINYINCKDRVTLSLSGRKTHLDRYRYTRKEPSQSWPKLKFWFPSTTIEPLTQTCRGSVIDIFALGPTGTMQNQILWFFIMAKVEISISVDNDGTLDPNLWGVCNWHFCSSTNRDLVNPILWFFIMAKVELSIAIDNAGTLDPNLWGVGNWHICSRTNRECVNPNFVIFHNGWSWNYDFCRQWWNPWPKLVGGQ